MGARKSPAGRNAVRLGSVPAVGGGLNAKSEAFSKNVQKRGLKKSGAVDKGAARATGKMS